MLDDFFERPRQRKLRDLNIVPILDMFTVIIFFLLLSASFVQFTKLTVPPSATVTTTDAGRALPKTPKLFVGTSSSGQMNLLLQWSGEQPGELKASANAETLFVESRKLVEAFLEKHPGESTLQLGLSSRIPYQSLIRVMDGARERMPDIILLSHRETEARMGGLQP